MILNISHSKWNITMRKLETAAQWRIFVLALNKGEGTGICRK
jgi:hypothetical protein